MKRLVVYSLVIAATVAVSVLLWQFRSIVILLALSLMLAAALRPSADYLIERRVPAGLARGLVYLALFAVLGLGLFFLSGRLLAELQLLSNYLVVLYDSTFERWQAGTPLQQTIAARLPTPDQLPEMLAGPSGTAIAQLLLGATQSVATVAGSLLIIVVLSLYWSSDRAHFERLWLSFLPSNLRVQARNVWLQTESSMGAYLRSEMVQALMAIVMLALAFQVMGLHYPLLTALLAGTAWLIPMAGFVFGAGFAFLAGLATTGEIQMAVAAVIVTAVVMVFLEFVVEPRFFERNEFSGLLITLLVLVMVDAYGLIGFIIAPPLAVLLQILLSHTIRALQRPPSPELQLDTLEQRFNAVFATYNGLHDGDTPPPPELGNLLKRLEALVDRAREEAQEPVG